MNRALRLFKRGDVRIKSVLGALILLVVASACGGSGSVGTTSSSSGGSATSGLKGQRFILEIQGTGDATQVLETHALGLLKTQGVDASVKFNASSTNIAISELRSGAVDGYSEALSGGLGAIAAGIPLTDIALEEPRQDYVMLARKGINTPADLKGKKIGVQDTTGVNYAQALLVLGKAGLKASDAQILAIGGQSSRLPALLAGRVDATMLSHSAEDAVAGRGFNVIFDYTKQASNLYDDNLFVTKAWASTHRTLAVAFNKAMLQTFTWFNDPKNANQVVQGALKISPAENSQSLVKLFDTLRGADWAPNGSILDPAALDFQQKLYFQAGAIKQTVPVTQWVDDGFAKQAKSSLNSTG